MDSPNRKKYYCTRLFRTRLKLARNGIKSPVNSKAGHYSSASRLYVIDLVSCALYIAKTSLLKWTKVARWRARSLDQYGMN